MGVWGAHRFPPRRLAALSDTRLRWIRPLWFAALALALVADIAGTVFVWRDAYERDPQFARFALASQIEADGSVTVSATEGSEFDPPIAPRSHILAIDRTPIAPDAKVWTVADRLAAVRGESAILTVMAPGGRTTDHRVMPSDRFAREEPGAQLIPRDGRMAIRLAISLLTCVTLIACATMLFLRRPHDPVAMLFSFSFLLFAAIVDPPLIMWPGVGLGAAFDVLATVAWILLVVGLAVFPDGEFNPRPVGWVLAAAPLVGAVLAIDSLPNAVDILLAFVFPLLLLGCQVIKYRRYPPGIERQQVKWAAFGFAAGLILLTVTYTMLELLPETSPNMPLYGLILLALFSAGFLAMALGLLISLVRFRLWEADQVIGRSAVAAAVTLAVGIIWTLSMDLVKTGVELTLGEANATIAVAASAVLAAGIFAPTQTLALRWAKRKFDHENDRIRKLIARLAVWRTAETPEEIGMRSLSAIAAAVHCSSAAILIDTPHGRSVVASRDLEDVDRLADAHRDPAADQRFVQSLPLEDEDGPIGQLLLGPRSDFNRYNSGQLAAMREVTEPLAEALRAAVKRMQHADSVHRLIGSVEERLNRLEQGGRGLSPA